MKPLRLFALLALLLSVPALAGEDGWTVYDPCEFEEDEYYDGDSFQLKTPSGYVYIFRLYGVDTPETDKRYPDRIKEQAEYFGIPESRVVSWGERAARFTRRFLKGGDIVAHTRKEKSGTASSKNRYYAIIEVDEERLDEALVAAGLARAYGMAASYPRKISERVFQSRLKRAEAEARKKKVGIWGASESD